MTEPERIPIEAPEGRYRSIDQDYTTTHKGFDGTWYQIRNSSSVEADNRLYQERNRNAGLRLKAELEEEDRLRAEKRSLAGNDPAPH